MRGWVRWPLRPLEESVVQMTVLPAPSMRPPKTQREKSSPAWVNTCELNLSENVSYAFFFPLIFIGLLKCLICKGMILSSISVYEHNYHFCFFHKVKMNHEMQDMNLPCPLNHRQTGFISKWCTPPQKITADGFILQPRALSIAGRHLLQTNLGSLEL